MIFRAFIYDIQKKWYKILEVRSTRKNEPQSFNK